ncbi:proton channel OTOP3-like [Eucyclogobius newberryi]|uniref:proton channel OTOP3-like n=1 Tax=Eucyclogobius newberryi TaxID=166745 RepID=UPI003B5A00C1
MDPDFSISSTMGQASDHDPPHEQQNSELMPSGRGLVSGLFGLNMVLLGGALLAGRAMTDRQDVLKWEPKLMLLFLMALSVAWMLWFILWDSRRPGSRPHRDHHAGGVTVMLVLLLFAGLSLILCVFRIGLLVSMRKCKPLEQLALPVMEMIFLCLQTYLLWAHSKDCIHIHKVITRAGLMVTLCADLLLWLNAVTDDTLHQEIELEKEDGLTSGNYAFSLDVFGDLSNATACRCNSDPACLSFQKGFEVLFPFSMEYYLMSGCMIYVMWKNVARTLNSARPHSDHKLTFKIVCGGGIIYGFAFGGLVLVAGVTVFILYQVWVGQSHLRLTAFVLFYGYHLAVMPVMSCCSLAGLLVHRFERRAHEGGHNPTRSLDVLLLTVTALGQLALSYFSMVAAFAIGTGGILGDLDLSYSALSLLELVLQNIFIIEGLHRHPSIKAKKKPKSTMFKLKKKSTESEERKAGFTLLDGVALPAGPKEESKKTWTKTIIQEICAFLVLSNIMLWIIPAFGIHPQFENGLGKQFFGFSSWFVLVNLGQPLTVFYRMHSVAALMELLINAK